MRFLLPIGLLAFVSSVVAEPEFAHIFTDHAVLQRDRPVLVYGVGADPKTPLSLRFGSIIAEAEVSENGDWQAHLPALPAETGGRSLTLLAGKSPVAVVNDVVVGEVWLAAGQSNMQFTVAAMVKGLPETKAWVGESHCPGIRFRRINDPVLPDRTAKADDLADAMPWTVMTPDSVVQFSAVAAAFARTIESGLQVPIGVIDVSWGGKPIESFIPREAFSTPFLKTIRELADTDSLEDLAALEGGVIIRNPEGHPGAIFQARVAPLSRFGLRGFLWYQAESNAGTGEDPRGYRDKMEALVSGWRTRWDDETLPFYFVQLPSFPGASGWIRVREEQRRSLSIPNTGMAVTIDLPGEEIHPPDKLPVGDRLARLALHHTYGKKSIVPSGPAYRDHVIQSDLVSAHFTGIDGGLAVHNGAELKWFELAGEDGIWQPATASIQGDTVQVRSEQVTQPVAVRYACGTNCQDGLLFNGAGLPASPFCSDLEMLPWTDVPKRP